MANSIKIGAIKKCPNGHENYVREGNLTCPDCGLTYGTTKKNKSPDVIVFLGSAEISRRSVVQLKREGYID